eukprot:TRINITY_DN57611_c0_g1_i1.p1 TRINITY_DN57611_c0_g1~~TRINITY_DN57611_c0_g1_i1.p1  ORF type:complete len:452 (+),score=78.24 TRINITY_DN57611_c0_g1_i1:146-1501(+)
MLQPFASTGPLDIGDSVEIVSTPEMKGVVRFFGEVGFADGLWLGVELDGPFGLSDGSLNGRRYFDCKPLHAVFLRPKELAKVGGVVASIEVDPVAEEDIVVPKIKVQTVGGSADTATTEASPTAEVKDKQEDSDFDLYSDREEEERGEIQMCGMTCEEATKTLQKTLTESKPTSPRKEQRNRILRSKSEKKKAARALEATQGPALGRTKSMSERGLEQANKMAEGGLSLLENFATFLGTEKWIVVVGGVATLWSFLVWGFLGELVGALLGYFYPMYASFRVLTETRDPDDVVSWLQCWVSFACLTLVEYSLYKPLSAVPGYHLIRLAVISSLYMPQFRLPQHLYFWLFRPVLRVCRPRIEAALESSAAGLGGDICDKLQQAAGEGRGYLTQEVTKAAAKHLTQAAVEGHGLFTPESPKPATKAKLPIPGTSALRKARSASPRPRIQFTGEN